MKEDLLHFIWKFQKFSKRHLFTSCGSALQIVNPGMHNQNSGPDFLDARLRLNEHLWAGHVELHLKSSDWYAHRHEVDSGYNNVVLHVVWEDDIAVFRSDQTEIPALELKYLISKEMLLQYQKLFAKREMKLLNCQNLIGSIDSFLWKHWLERLYFERLEHKTKSIFELLRLLKNDWETSFFILLLRAFGSKVNAQAFESLAKAVDLGIVRKLHKKPEQLECVLLGMSGLLSLNSPADAYLAKLNKEYAYLKKKFSLSELPLPKPQFYGLRPLNFPTIRLSQFANLWAYKPGIFQEVIHMWSLEEFYDFFRVRTTAYWERHYTFGKPAKPSVKRLSKAFVELLLLNTIVPLKFCYDRYYGRTNNTEILNLVRSIAAEENQITRLYNSFNIRLESGLESQASIQLFQEYCSKNRCLHCAVGTQLLSGK